MSKLQLLRKALVVSTVSCGLMGCGEGPSTGPAQTSVTIDDRLVTAMLDVPGDIQKDGDSALISASGVKVKIEKETVRINDNDSGKIPATAKRVDVTIVAGVLTVNADDSPIASMPIKSKDSN